MSQPTPAALFAAHWYARPNDLVGGWCVMAADAPPSSGAPVVVDLITHQSVAEHIAQLHNWAFAAGYDADHGDRLANGAYAR